MAWKSVPICEVCFIDQEAAISHATGVPSIAKAPYQLEPSVRQVETCYSCEEATIVGIYVRRDVEEEAEDESPSFGGGIVFEPRAVLEGPL